MSFLTFHPPCGGPAPEWVAFRFRLLAGAPGSFTTLLNASAIPCDEVGGGVFGWQGNPADTVLNIREWLRSTETNLLASLWLPAQGNLFHHWMIAPDTLGYAIDLTLYRRLLLESLELTAGEADLVIQSMRTEGPGFCAYDVFGQLLETHGFSYELEAISYRPPAPPQRVYNPAVKPGVQLQTFARSLPALRPGRMAVHRVDCDNCTPLERVGQAVVLRQPYPLWMEWGLPHTLPAGRFSLALLDDRGPQALPDTVVAAGTFQHVAGVNQLGNQNGNLQSWTVADETGALGGYAGRYKLVQPSPGPGQSQEVRLSSNNLNLLPGKTYRWELWVKVDAASAAWVPADEILEPSVLDAISFTKVESWHRETGSTDRWVRLQIEFIAGAVPIQLQLGFIQPLNLESSEAEFHLLTSDWLLTEVLASPVVLAQSEPLELRPGDPWLPLLMARGLRNHPELPYGLAGAQQTVMHCPLAVEQPQPTSELTLYTRTDGSVQLVNARQEQRWRLQSGFMDAARHRALALWLAHPEVDIQTDTMLQELAPVEGYTTEWPDTLPRPLLARGACTLAERQP